MTAIAYSRFRSNPARIVEEMFESAEPVTVTRADGRDFVIIPLREWESWMETLHLLKSAKNAARLRKSLREMESDEVELIDIK